MKKFILSAVFAATAMLGTTATASSLKIIGGETQITVTPDLSALNPALTGNVTVPFAITGGSVSPGQSLIEHVGSLVSLSDGTTTATVGDFLIDTAAANVLGRVNGGPLTTELFVFGPEMSLPGVQLLFSEGLATAVNGLFGTSLVGGKTEFGYAVPNPQVVPLPAGAVLLLTGVGALAWRGRRKAA